MKVFLEAYGCTLNQGEGRIMVDLLRQGGHEIVGSPEAAEACVVVTCTVIETTERKMTRRMEELAALGKELVVAGCMASVQRRKVLEVVPQARLLSPLEVQRIQEVLPGPGRDGLGCPVESPSVDGVVPIAQGCLANCTYCISKRARGTLRSYPLEGLMERVRWQLSRGCKEIRLTALDTAQWGRELGLGLPDLLREVCGVEGEFMVRVGMMNPLVTRFILDDLVEAYRSPKVFKFLHLPVQSGDEGILRVMRRGYRVADFVAIVESFRQAYPHLTLSTDIIVGFPGETEDAFQRTMDLMAEVKPDIINVTRFSRREDTPAANMGGQVAGWRVKNRSRRLTALHHQVSMEINRRYVGQRWRLLTTEGGKDHTTIARGQNYKQVVLPGEMPLGAFLEAEVTEAKAAYLLARPSGMDP